MLTEMNFTLRMLIMQAENRIDATVLVFPMKIQYNSDFEFRNVYGY